MRIRVERTAGSVGARLVDPDDFAGFAVELETGLDTGAGLEAARAALAGRLDFDGEQAWVDEPWLRDLGGFDSGGRREPYRRMLAYARDHGWLDAAGRVAAHVVTVGVHTGR
jgi:hypothetical protein